MALFGIGCFEGFLFFMAMGVGLIGLMVKLSSEKNKQAAYQRENQGLPPIQTPSIPGQIVGGVAKAVATAAIKTVFGAIKK
jgi:hypothetical protein